MGKAFVYNTGLADDDKKEDELRLTFGIFIDGTLNNKKNTQLRRFSRKETANSTITEEKKKDDIKREQEDYEKITDGEPVTIPSGFENLEEYKKYLVGVNRTFLDRQGTDNSYSNDDTNVARMWSCCDEDYAIYVEGMGTSDNKQDSQDGFAFGSGTTGVRARVRLACERVVEHVQKRKSIRADSDKKVTQITFDVFGFSRGATSARNFVHEVNTKKAYPVKPIEIPDGYDSYTVRGEPRMIKRPPRKAQGDYDGLEIDPKGLIDGKLPKFGHLGYSLLKSKVVTPKEFEGISIVVRFVGVYDTVSSYYERGALGAYNSFGELEDDNNFLKLTTFSDEDFQNDEKELGLHELGDVTKFEKMVHFTAQDEHRKNFVLTRINQIPDKAIEKNLPGVHCDIGGAYENEDYEIIKEIGTSLKDSKYTSKVFKWKKPVPFPYSLLPEPEDLVGLDALKQDLVDQYWYVDDELKIRGDWAGYSKLTGKRKVKKEYSYIALHFMEEYCNQTTMCKYITLPVAPKYPLGSFFLEEVKEHLHMYVFGNAPEWKFKSDGQLAKDAYELKEKEEEEKRENIRKALIKQIDDDIKSGKFLKEEMTMKTDNLDPSIYRPKILEKEIKEQELKLDTEVKPTMLEEVVIYGYSRQKALRTLRHEYLHWSSNRKWFGMEPPNDNRQREFFPRK